MVDLTGINKIDKNAVVQYSYPIAKINSSTSNTFYLNFYGFTQNFSASFKIGETDTYISGICTKAIITGKSHNIGSDNHDGELVLEHKKSDNMPFYVVFPLKFGSTTESQVDTLFKPSPQDQVIDLNENLKDLSTKMICYRDSGGNRPFVFVFKDSLSVKANKPTTLQKFSSFNGIMKAPESTKKNAKMIQAAIAITGTNTQDEVECEYIKEVDENISVVDKTFALNVVYWMFAFTLMSVSVFYGLTWVQNVPPLTDDIKSNIFKILIGIGTILFIIFVSLFFSKSMNVNYGATSIFSLYIVAIASYALIGGLRH
jgi:hypothetical protein